MEVLEAKQVRFAKLVEVGGKPTTYLAFGDVEKDKSFMRAVKEDRVVTIKQEPASKHKDFGVIGFLKEKYVTYLVFPKALREFSGQRVIGIKYDVLGSADVIAFGEPQKAKKSSVAKGETEAKVQEPEPPKQPKKEKPKKPKPEPKRFSVRVRITGTVEKDLEVTAWNEREAKSKVREEVEGSVDFSKASVETKVLGVRKIT